MNKQLDSRQFAEQLEKKYGHKSANVASDPEPYEVIPTGSLSLDYTLGTGGWPSRYPIEVFGPPDIGKSALGLYAIANAQQQGKSCVVIAVEPGFDGAWAARHGVDPDNLIVARPDHGEAAFSMLYDCITGGADFVLFDSLGAVMWEKELEPGEQKSRAGGQAKLITDGVKRASMSCWKSGCTVMFINQIRDVMGSSFPVVDSPGGRALKHHVTLRVQLKPGEKHIRKIDGDDVMVGRQLIASIVRNKLAEGTNKRAIFDYYPMSHPEVPFGIDWTTDIINIGKRAGVIKTRGSYLDHQSFGTKYARDVIAQMKEDPNLVNTLRQEILEEMNKQVSLNGSEAG